MPYSRLSLVLAALIGAQTLPAAEHANPPPPPPPPEELFKTFDTDSNGSLSLEEFSAGLKSLAQHRQERRANGVDGGDRPPRPAGGDGGDQRPPHPPRPGGDDGGDQRPPPTPGGPGQGGGRPPRPEGQRPPPPPPAEGDGPRRPPPPGDGQQGPPDPAERERRVAEAFKTGDADKDGALTPAEFRAAMEAMPKPPRPPQGRPPQDHQK